MGIFRAGAMALPVIALVAGSSVTSLEPVSGQQTGHPTTAQAEATSSPAGGAMPARTAAPASLTYPARVSLAAGSRNLAPHTSGRLHGTVRAPGGKSLAGVRVRLQWRNLGGSSWHDARTRTTGAGGVFGFTVQPRHAREYRVRVPRAGKPALVSRVRTVTVTDPRRPLAGLVVALDPGHSGKVPPATKLVSDGRGRTKQCNNSGTSGAGISEHAFNFRVAKRTSTLLRRRGASVVLTRNSDNTSLPCIDVRGKFAQAHDADALVSIHANGSTNTTYRGHFAIVQGKVIHRAQGKASRTLARHLLAGLKKQKFEVSNTIRSGISRRTDLATINFSARPVVLLELGEMKNASDVAVMRTASGQQRYARAITQGIAAWASAR